MRNIKLLLAFALTILLTSCERDNVDDWNTANKITFSFVTAAKSNVDINTRAVSEAAESDVNSVYVFIFKGGEKTVEGYISDLTLTNSGEYTRTYTGTLEGTNTLRGASVKVYAVANPATEMWNNLADLQTAANAGEESFKEQLYTVSQSFTEPLGTSITLIGMAGADGSASIDTNGNLGTRIILKRPYASVAFNFINGAPAESDTNRAGHTVSFTPTSYDVYNIPSNSALFEGAEVTGLTHFNRLDQKFGTQTPNSFGFYMIENIQEAKNSVSNYYDRDKKDGTDFINAPEYGTYVRVYGKYEEKTADGKVILQGDVNYTIHLGDFSGGDYNAYSVERNHKYTYNVTINGVQQIIVEATAEDDSAQQYQHGAEGYIINTDGVDMVYTFDAHYEDAMIKIDTSNFDATGHGFILRVATPYMTDAAQNTILTWADFSAEGMTEEKFKQTYDIDWIQFYPIAKTNTDPTSRTAYPNADNQGKLMNVYELYHELYKLVDESDTTTSWLADYVNDKGIIYFMAFVNEYFYDVDPLDGGATDWTEFANAKPRSMYMLQNPDKSTDGNSTYATVLCAFEQKSIQTMFKKDGSVNAYGIEWYDETANANLKNFTGGVDNTNGYSNYFGSLVTGTTWNTYVNESALRYGFDGQPKGNLYNSLPNTSGENPGAYACMQRNRDLNGDDKIDANEKRWYLASSDQYVQMWIGETAIDPYARMSGVISATTENEYKALSHYYTSSNDAHRIYWASEAGSVGAYGYNPGQNTWMGQYHKVRCVRTLTSYDAEPATIYTKSNNQITMNHLQEGAYRESGAMVGEYAAHNELAQYLNQIPYSIEVASSEEVSAYTLDEPLYASPIVEADAEETTIAIVADDFSPRQGFSSCSVSGDDEITLTFTSGTQKFVITNDYINNLGAGVRVKLNFDISVTAYKGSYGNYSSYDATSDAAEDGNFGFCDNNNGWSHSSTSGCYAYTESMTDANGVSSIAIGFNLEGNSHDWYSQISSSYPVIVTISNLVIVTSNISEESALTLTTDENSAISGAKFYYTTVPIFSKNNPITLDANNSVSLGVLPVYIWAEGSNGYHSSYTLVSSGGIVRQSTSDAESQSRGPNFVASQAATERICAEHYTQENGADLGQWRIPNERELQVMGLEGFLDGTYLSRTTFSAYPNVGAQRYIFAWYEGTQRLELSATATGKVRCVRDVAVTETTTVATDGTSAGSYSDKGTLTSAN